MFYNIVYETENSIFFTTRFDLFMYETVQYETIKIRSIYIDNNFWYHYLNLIWATQRPEPIYFSIILLLIKLLLFKFFISYLK